MLAGSILLKSPPREFEVERTHDRFGVQSSARIIERINRESDDARRTKGAIVKRPGLFSNFDSERRGENRKASVWNRGRDHRLEGIRFVYASGCLGEIYQPTNGFGIYCEVLRAGIVEGFTMFPVVVFRRAGDPLFVELATILRRLA